MTTITFILKNFYFHWSDKKKSYQHQLFFLTFAHFDRNCFSLFRQGWSRQAKAEAMAEAEAKACQLPIPLFASSRSVLLFCCCKKLLFRFRKEKAITSIGHGFFKYKSWSSSLKASRTCRLQALQVTLQVLSLINNQCFMIDFWLRDQERKKGSI